MCSWRLYLKLGSYFYLCVLKDFLDHCRRLGNAEVGLEVQASLLLREIGPATHLRRHLPTRINFSSRRPPYRE